jgi:hypothetical protein
MKRLFEFGLGALLVAGGFFAAARLAAISPCGSGGARPADPLDPRSLRALVVFDREREADAIPAARGLGANLIVTHSAPDQATAAAARSAGVGYMAFLSTADVDRVWEDAETRARYTAMDGISGIYYEDDTILEGYTSPEDQERAYRRLKQLFPRALVIHPTRLDPMLLDSGYLDAIYRPDFTDAVTPYYYPVGTTFFGSFGEHDAWDGLLDPMLRELARRTPPGKPLLPVLQGFEQEGFPVGADFLPAQFAVYRRVWPDNESAAVFDWGDSPDPTPQSPLVGLAFRPELAAGTRHLFHMLVRESACSLDLEKPIIRRLVR